MNGCSPTVSAGGPACASWRPLHVPVGARWQGLAYCGDGVRIRRAHLGQRFAQHVDRHPVFVSSRPRRRGLSWRRTPAPPAGNPVLRRSVAQRPRRGTPGRTPASRCRGCGFRRRSRKSGTWCSAGAGRTWQRSRRRHAWDRWSSARRRCGRAGLRRHHRGAPTVCRSSRVAVVLDTTGVARRTATPACRALCSTACGPVASSRPPGLEHAGRYAAAVPVEQVHPRWIPALAAIPSSVCLCRSAWKVSTATGTGPPLVSPNGPDSYMPGPPSNDSAQAAPPRRSPRHRMPLE